MKYIYQRLLKEGNADQKYLRCPDLQDKNFWNIRSAITFNKADMAFAETVKPKPTGHDSSSITYQKMFLMVHG